MYSNTHTRLVSTLAVFSRVVAVAAAVDSTTRWAVDPNLWAASPVGRADARRSVMGETAWRALVAAQLARFDDHTAQRREACFAAALRKASTRHASVPTRTRDVMIISGASTISPPWTEVPQFVIDLAVHKRAYCRLHGFSFTYFAAEAFLDDLVQHRFGRWEFVKIFMMLRASRESPRAATLAWLDYDTWLDPTFARIPLGVYIDDALAEDAATALILGPVNGPNSGVALFLPNRREDILGRWLAAATRGHSECGFDQAALQEVILDLKVERDGALDVAYSCRKPECEGRMKCNYAFQRSVQAEVDTLRRRAAVLAATSGAASLAKSPLQSIRPAHGHEFTNGIVNDLFPFVSVVAPAGRKSSNSAWPRLHCIAGSCRLRPFFFGHKAVSWFYQAYATHVPSTSKHCQANMSLPLHYGHVKLDF